MLVIAGVVSMVALAGCTPAPPEPLPIPTSATASTPSATPTPEYTPGVDPDADVAAAIATYEAYVEASNNLVVSDRDTWDPVLDRLAEPYRSGSLEGYEELASVGEYFDGSAIVLSTKAVEVQPTIIVLHVCTDFTARILRDTEGQQIGADDDYLVKSMSVVFQADAAGELGWLIYHFATSELPC